MLPFPFITGSRAYGTPTEDSDIDLVLPPNGKTNFQAIMIQYSDNQDLPITYGKLNLILTNEPKQWELWLQATNELIEQAPVTRDFAIAYITKLFKANNMQKSISYDADPNE